MKFIFSSISVALLFQNNSRLNAENFMRSKSRTQYIYAMEVENSFFWRNKNKKRNNLELTVFGEN